MLWAKSFTTFLLCSVIHHNAQLPTDDVRIRYGDLTHA
jgi:hypothetical protein